MKVREGPRVLSHVEVRGSGTELASANTTKIKGAGQMRCADTLWKNLLIQHLPIYRFRVRQVRIAALFISAAGWKPNVFSSFCNASIQRHFANSTTSRSWNIRLQCFLRYGLLASTLKRCQNVFRNHRSEFAFPFARDACTPMQHQSPPWNSISFASI